MRSDRGVIYLPESLRESQIVSSNRHGWLLMKVPLLQGKAQLHYYNALTDKVIDLPPLEERIEDNASFAFSENPTRDSNITVIGKPGIDLRFLYHAGGDSWESVTFLSANIQACNSLLVTGDPPFVYFVDKRFVYRINAMKDMEIHSICLDGILSQFDGYRAQSSQGAREYISANLIPYGMDRLRMPNEPVKSLIATTLISGLPGYASIMRASLLLTISNGLLTGFCMITLFELTFAKDPYMAICETHCDLLTINIWYVPRKEDVFSKPDDILTAAEKYIEENGPDAFEKIIHRADKSRRSSGYPIFDEDYRY
ncbi:hypothetical protein Tsubulata_014566 [Turnera subulata]|uniref:KIB1-4 beta-propeller domain-containing protein n=1 Tax=Turnera subulata TaxID=218843 RepID=A0A9Q0FGW4_9ROSI|nr:hypothetical protein Tsubulata_014566 [Turnera subulata]